MPCNEQEVHSHHVARLEEENCLVPCNEQEVHSHDGSGMEEEDDLVSGQDLMLDGSPDRQICWDNDQVLYHGVGWHIGCVCREVGYMLYKSNLEIERIFDYELFILFMVVKLKSLTSIYL